MAICFPWIQACLERNTDDSLEKAKSNVLNIRFLYILEQVAGKQSEESTTLFHHLSDLMMLLALDFSFLWQINQITL